MRHRASAGALRRLLAGSLIALAGVLAAPAAALALDEFTLPNPASQPSGITTGPDGALWFTEENGNRVGRITTTGQITEFPVLPSAGSLPAEITTGPDGNLWFTESGAAKVARLVPGNGNLTEFPTPTPGSAPDGIVTGPDGKIWFTEFQVNKIGRIDPGTGNIDEFPVPTTASGPSDITVGPDGRLWFTESIGHKVGRIDPNNPSDIADFATPTPLSDPSGIIASGGALWFTEFGANQVGRVSTTGAFTEFPIPTANSGPSSIAIGSDGALWFTEESAGKIGRLTTGGSFTEFALPASTSTPSEIAAGPDNALWFTELNANKIGRIPAPTPPALGCPPICPLPPPPAKLSLRSLRVAPSAFKAAPKGPTISAKVGAKISYRLSMAASTRFTIERETAGRKKGRRCVPQTKRNRRAKACKRYVALRGGSFSRAGKAGSNSFKFSGRLRNKKLRPGRYRLGAVATAGASTTKASRAGFKIVRR